MPPPPPMLPPLEDAGRVAAEGGVGDGQRARVVDAAADGVTSPPVIVRPGDRHLAPASTVKIRNSGVPEAALRATVRTEAPGPLTMRVAGQVGQGRQERDRPGDRRGEVDRVLGRVHVGLGDRGAERAGAGVVRVHHRERARHDPALQRLQPPRAVPTPRRPHDRTPTPTRTLIDPERAIGLTSIEKR